MVKKFKQDLRKQEILQEEKLLEKSEELILLRKRDFLRDNKRSALKTGKQFKKTKITLYDSVHRTSDVTMPKDIPKQQKEIQTEVYAYKVAKDNVESVLNEFESKKIKNQRPPDYLVEMYKSDKQMLKVRRFITEKEERIKQKMQGKDWMSKTKRRERAKKKAESKKAKKKAKQELKRPTMKSKSIKKDKINGKNKVKK